MLLLDERKPVEEGILGILFAYPESISEFVELGVSPDMFSKGRDLLLDKILDFFLEDKVPTPALVGRSLGGSNANKSQAITDYLVKLVDNTLAGKESKENLRHYVDDLKDIIKKERLTTWASKMLEASKSHAKTGSQMEAELMQILMDAEEEDNALLRSVRLKDGLIQFLNNLEVKATNPNDSKTFLTPTGFRPLDEAWNGGIRKQSLVLVAARPGNCKTTFLLNAALNAALHYNIPTAFLSFEMGLDEVLLILFSMLTEKLFPNEGVPTSKLEQPHKLTPDDWYKLVRAIKAMRDIPMYLEDCDGMTTLQLEAKIMKLSKMGVDSFYQDYWQLIRLPNGRLPKEEAEYAETSEALRRMTKRFNCKIVAGAQINRGSEHREVKQPTLSDIRNSGKAEQDAHRVITLHYPEMYDRDQCERPNELDVAVVKDRRGKTFKFTLFYKKEFSLLEDLHPQYLGSVPPTAYGDSGERMAG